MYMATTNWRGALHIDPMRLFETESEAVAYVKSLAGGEWRVYLLSATEPPKRIKL